MAPKVYRVKKEPITVRAGDLEVTVHLGGGVEIEHPGEHSLEIEHPGEHSLEIERVNHVEEIAPKGVFRRIRTYVPETGSKTSLKNIQGGAIYQDRDGFILPSGRKPDY
jgi:hypothetical protein